jgi:tRNA dimethylallyltransferase
MARADEIPAPSVNRSLATLESRAAIRIGMVAGPTGAGKTAFALEVAERLGAEIVNADSRQLYRGMDLGTAKPTAQERLRVPHHLIDIRDPDAPLDVADYAALARAALTEIAARGRPALIVGGSGLYLRALRDGIFAGPAASPQYRAELIASAAAQGAPQLHWRLAQVDPAAAARIGPADLPRIVRALEVHALSGIPISEHQRRHREAGGEQRTGTGGYENLAVGLAVARERLYARIDRRFDAMVAAGLIEEVRGLLAAGYGAASVMLQTIGYREIAQYLSGKVTLAAGVAAAKRESRRLAKRQMTWFRREPGLIWLDPDDGIAEALRLFEGFFRRPAAAAEVPRDA